MMISFGLLLIAVCIGQAVISYMNAKKALVNTVNLILPQVAVQARDSVEGDIIGQLNALEAIADNDKIKDKNVPITEKMLRLDNEVKRSGHIAMGIADINGNEKFTNGKTTNIKDREYFKRAIEGNISVSDPIVSQIDNSIIVAYAVPIKNNNEVIGVLTALTDGNVLSEFIKEIKFGTTGQAFMIKNDGTIIAHRNKDLVINMDNSFENIKKDPSLKGLVEIEKKMVQGESGVGEYVYNNQHKFVAYAPIESTGWSIAIAVEKDEVLSELSGMGIYALISSLVFVVGGMILVFVISASISKSIKASVKHLKLIAKGDFTLHPPKKYMQRQDEIGEMAKAVDTMQGSIVGMIKTIKDSSSSIDEQSMNLSSVAQEMSASSENVSTAIQEVAQGAGTQAEELVNSTTILNDFGLELEEMVKSIEQIACNTKEIQNMADGSNDDMNNVINSVERVTSTFNELTSQIGNVGENVNRIYEITDLINSIAEQTNLLALNAAIEAARAGEAGKGFSVVAEEIRKLSEQSKDSSQNIAELISKISKNTDIMIENTDTVKNELVSQKNDIDTAIKSFGEITKAVDEINPKIEGTNTSAVNIENKKNVILEKIEAVSSIAEEVSASSEEVSASSEEMNSSTEEVALTAQSLSEMTKEMMDQINKFKI
nr:methyl-accepting chemotaxis protein [Clostridium ganghwense]